MIDVIKEAAINPKIKIANKLSLLWGKELRNILVANGLSKTRYKNKPDMRKALLKLILEDELALFITNELFERDYTLQPFSK